MSYTFSNYGTSTLASSITNVATSLTVQTGGGANFPSTFPFIVVLGDITSASGSEIVKCTARSSDTLTIVRAQESSTAAAWGVGTIVTQVTTAGVLNELVGTGNGQKGVSISGLAGSPDIVVAGTNDWEFDSSSTTGWTSFAPGGAVTFDANTTTLGHLYLKVASNSASDKFGGIIHAVTPSAPYTITAKLVDYTPLGGAGTLLGLFVSDSSTAAGNSVFIGTNANYSTNKAALVRGGSFTNMQTFAGFVDTGALLTNTAPLYLRIIVHAANNIDTLFSLNGLAWYTAHSGYSLLSTAGYFGVALDPFSADCQTYWDWIRFS